MMPHIRVYLLVWHRGAGYKQLATLKEKYRILKPHAAFAYFIAIH